MTPRFDHVGVIVQDLDAAVDFFLSLGFEREGGTTFDEDPGADRITGLKKARADMVMVGTPDGSGKLELIQYHVPADEDGPQPWPPNRLGYRHLCIEIDDVEGTVERLREKGLEPVGDIVDYGSSFRLVYVRGPEGMIVELAERLNAPV